MIELDCRIMDRSCGRPGEWAAVMIITYEALFELHRRFADHYTMTRGRINSRPFREHVRGACLFDGASYKWDEGRGQTVILFRFLVLSRDWNESWAERAGPLVAPNPTDGIYLYADFGEIIPPSPGVGADDESNL